MWEVRTVFFLGAGFLLRSSYGGHDEGQEKGAVEGRWVFGGRVSFRWRGWGTGWQPFHGMRRNGLAAVSRDKKTAAG